MIESVLPKYALKFRTLHERHFSAELPHNHVMQDVFADRNVQVEVSEEAEGLLCHEPHR